MKKTLFILIAMCGFLTHAQVKIGDNPTTIGTSSSLELESTNKGLVITRVANLAAITTPVNGMVVYDISSGCVKTYEGGAWTNCLSNGANIQNSTNGSAVVASYVCTTGSSGILYSGVTPVGVTQTITADVTSVGTYNISAPANGVVFAQSGTFFVTGIQTITLIAIGAPATTGDYTFPLNTSPSCSFTRAVIDHSTNGFGIVSSYNCSTASTGTMVAGTSVSGVTQTITATVTKIGNYVISMVTNGVTFSKSSNFTALGAQTIVLTAIGTPISATASPYTYTLNTTPNCSFTREVTDPSTNGTGVVSGYSCSTALAGTLYVNSVITGVTQTITATVTTIGSYNLSMTVNGITFTGNGNFTGLGAQAILLTAAGIPAAIGTSTFTLNTTPNCGFPRTTINQPSTNGTGTVSGYVCTTASTGNMVKGTAVTGVSQTLTATVTIAGTYNITTVSNGVTFTGSDTFAGTGLQQIVLTATGTPASATASPYSYTLNTTPNCSFTRAVTDPSTNGTAVVTAYNCTGVSTGTMTVGTPVSGVTQTITATVSTAGTYNISILANGVTFLGSSNFAGTGSQPITLTASGTPTAVGTNSFALNTIPTCSFSRSTGAAFTNTVCAATIGNFPATTSVGGVPVTTILTGTTNGYATPTLSCGVAITGSYVGLVNSQTATYTFSQPLKNVQIIGAGNELSENEGYTVTASLAGTTVAIQLVPFGTNCMSSFTATQSGNSGNVSVIGASSTTLFNISSAGTYDTITVTRSGGNTTGASTHGILLCNATAVPNNTTGGTAVVSAYSCSGASIGTLTAGTTVSGVVSQVVTATVTTAGTYNISTTANGITFTGSGTFPGTGSQTITMTASGTPVTAGTTSFPLNSTPTCSFPRSVGAAFNSTACAATVGVYPVLATISGTDVIINKTTTTDLGNVTNPSLCGISPTGSSYKFGFGNSATYTFSVPVKNIQVFGSANESNEDGEGYVVSATYQGTAVPVQLVPFAGSCNNNFTSSQSGNSASIRNFGTTTTSGLVFNISSTAVYDAITISRAGVDANGTNNHSLMVCNATAVPSTTNGTAVVSSYECTTSSAGVMEINAPVLGVTQTITANVTTIGDYVISSNTVNGVTFAKSGTFSSTGAIPVVLLAQGTPTIVGSNIFTLNTSPNCPFTRTSILNASSNGTSAVASYTCSGTSTGTMTTGTVVSGVTQVVSVNVTTVGTYSISATANGVTFTGANTFATTGVQNITLTASGTPTAAGTNAFVLNTTPNCSFNRSSGAAFTSTVCGSSLASFPIITSAGGTSVTVTKTTSTDSGAAAISTSCGVTVTGGGVSFSTTQAATYTFTVPLKNVQIVGTGLESGENEGFTVSASLAGVAVPVQAVLFGTNCGSNFTNTQSNNTATVINTGSAANISVLFNISSASAYDAITIQRVGTTGGNTHGLLLCNATAVPSTSNGTAVVSGYSCSTAMAGTMMAGVTVSGVTQTITANVTTVGSYVIYSDVINGVTFSATGNFASTGSQPVVLIASGMPTAAGVNTFTLSTSPNCPFDRTTIINPSSNGNAAVSAYDCTAGFAGTLTASVVPSGVTQSVTATVGVAGTYAISTNTVNGVTFAGSLTFSGTGAQVVVLTATGTPTAVGSSTFTLLTTPNCTFNRTINAHPSSNGTAIFSAMNCAGATVSNTFPAGLTASGTVTVPVTVTTAGTYTFTTPTVNGMFFSGTNTLAVGSQNIVLNAGGIPTAMGTFSYSIPGTVGCTISAVVVANNTSGGSAVVSAYSCTGTSTGAMYAGTSITTVTQNVTATVTTAGSYFITAIVNGVTFTGSSSFAGTGSQTITLTAGGTPTLVGTHSFALSTTPTCSFTRNTLYPFNNTVCPTSQNSYPSATSAGGTAVTIIKTTSADSGPITNVAACGLPVNGNAVSLSLVQSASYGFSVPVKNVEIYGFNNESSEAEGYAVTATLAGVSVPVQISIVTGGSCNGNFVTSTTGNLANITNTSGTGSLVFTISSSSRYDAIKVQRTGNSGANGHAIMMCNASTTP